MLEGISVAMDFLKANAIWISTQMAWYGSFRLLEDEDLDEKLCIALQVSSVQIIDGIWSSRIFSLSDEPEALRQKLKAIRALLVRDDFPRKLNEPKSSIQMYIKCILRYGLKHLYIRDNLNRDLLNLDNSLFGGAERSVCEAFSESLKYLPVFIVEKHLVCEELKNLIDETVSILDAIGAKYYDTGCH